MTFEELEQFIVDEVEAGMIDLDAYRAVAKD